MKIPLSYFKTVFLRSYLENIPFHNVAVENVIPIHSDGNPCRSVCSYTYQDSKVENNMEVEIPPKSLPISNI